MEKNNMSNNQFEFKNSLLSLLMTGIFATINHYFDMGLLALVVFGLITILPVVIVYLYSQSGSRALLVGLLFQNLFVIVGFGIVDGLINHTFNLVEGYIVTTVQAAHGIDTSPQDTSTLFLDLSGFLVFLSCLWVTRNMLKLYSNFSSKEDHS